ncbi:alpha/beta hydrolase [Frankia sp. CNm7]|uniref:Alpha/beta hydrolase n=1 Tax=Frankia nepalensis TaxID=1836974 RepID=A0A937RP27_9ACTN|nr:alpha/beta hydrolase [Frankia nepalensis]MBL7502138.1 alpha/beta hydrolase [Frankia nepalensis]MBL7514372.1 alpha/beta hydrolase [Frankia nepalensis]MBL7520022.1 alpha/beta hydrolase [Frankia nepalensis]MBL7633710.1 alpha/beta hydrolase [Frankia nepalensis]
MTSHTLTRRPVIDRLAATRADVVDHDDFVDHALGDDVGPGGPALLYLTGFGANRSVWRATARMTAGWRRSVTMDWRRHGTNPPGPHDYTLADLADDALGVLDALGIDRFVPVASAHSGWVALELARRFPRRVPAVILVGWMPLGAPEPFLAGLDAMRDPERWQGAVAGLTGGWVRGHEHVPGLVDTVEGMRAQGFDMWSRAAELISEAFHRHRGPLAAFGRLENPVPVLHQYAAPTDSGFLSAQLATALHTPWFEVHRLDHARSHFPMLEAPEEIAARAESFLRARLTTPAGR